MARASKILTSRIRLAVIGILLLGSAGGVWAATGGPPQLRQAANTLTNTGADATSTPSGQEPTVTPSDDSSQTSANGSPTPTSHGTPTPSQGARRPPRLDQAGVRRCIGIRQS